MFLVNINCKHTSFEKVTTSDTQGHHVRWSTTLKNYSLVSEYCFELQTTPSSQCVVVLRCRGNAEFPLTTHLHWRRPRSGSAAAAAAARAAAARTSARTSARVFYEMLMKTRLSIMSPVLSCVMEPELVSPERTRGGRSVLRRLRPEPGQRTW